MKKRYYILIFITLTIIIILTDILIFDHALTRDLLSKHIREGMENTQVASLIGMPARDVGSGLVIHEYPLLFDNYFYVVYGSDCKVVNTIYPEAANPLQGFVLPSILLLIAGVETAVYFALRRHHKKN